MAQLYGSNREEPYAPSHGSTQNVYLVARPSRPDETNQPKIKPLVVNYHPSGRTAGPQRYVAEIQTVSQEVIRRPVAVPVKEIGRDYGSHVDGRSKGDNQFIARLQDAAIEANTSKLLGLNLDQAQGVPTNYQGRSTIDDRWSVQPNSLEEQNPRKVAELFNKVSTWRGTNGLDRGRSGDTYDRWSNNPGDRYKQPTQSNAMYGNSHNDSYAGRNNNLQAPRSGRSYNDQGGSYVGNGGQIERPFTPQGYDNHGKPGSINGNYGSLDNSYTGQTESLRGSGGLNKPHLTQQSYGQPASYGGDTHGRPSSMRGDHSNGEDSSYGNHGNVEAPRVGSGYTGQRENLNGGSGLKKPLSTHQGYDQPASYRGDTNMKPGGVGDSQQAPRAGIGYTGLADQVNGGTGWKKPIATQQGYDQPTSYGGDGRRSPISKSSEYSSNENKGYGNPVKSGEYQGRSNNPQAPQRYDYNRPRSEYDGGKQGYGYGYGDGVDTRRQDKPAYETYGSGYNSSMGPNTVRPAGMNAPEITGKQAVRKYNGAFV